MSPVLRNWRRVVCLAGVMAGVAIHAPAQSQGRGRAIEFSEPRSEVTATNLDQTTAKKSSLRSLEQAVKKPFDVFDPLGTGSETFRPQQRPLNPNQPNFKSKKAREMIERRKNWVFLTPEEMNGIEKPEEMMNVTEYDSDGLPRAKKSKLELYYDRMRQAEKDGNTNQVNNAALPGANPNGDKGDLSAEDDKTSSRSIFAAADLESKRSAPAVDSGKPSPVLADTAERRFTEFFGFASPGATEKPLEKNPAAEARMREYKQLFETRSPVASSFAVSGNPLASPVTPAFSAPTFSAGSFGSPPPPPVAPAPGFSPFSIAPSPPSLAPAYTPPLQPAYRPPAPVPAFQLPQRKY